MTTIKGNTLVGRYLKDWKNTYSGNEFLYDQYCQKPPTKLMSTAIEAASNNISDSFSSSCILFHKRGVDVRETHINSKEYRANVLFSVCFNTTSNLSNNVVGISHINLGFDLIGYYPPFFSSTYSRQALYGERFPTDTILDLFSIMIGRICSDKELLPTFIEFIRKLTSTSKISGVVCGYFVDSSNKLHLVPKIIKGLCTMNNGNSVSDICHCINLDYTDIWMLREFLLSDVMKVLVMSSAIKMSKLLHAAGDTPDLDVDVDQADIEGYPDKDKRLHTFNKKQYGIALVELNISK